MKKQEITAFMDWAKRRIGSGLFERCGIYDDSVDYLGPEKLTKMKVLKPAAAWARFSHGFDFNLAGWLHDCLYRIGGDEAFRQWADNIFREAMEFLLSCPWYRIPAAMLARVRATGYFALVRFAGSTFFSYREVR
jgi:hypothetical protein